MQTVAPDAETDALIVGSGQAGASAALALSTYGVPNIVVTRYASLADTPRAHLTNQRTMEVPRDLGVEDEVVAKATPQHLMGDTTFCSRSSPAPTSPSARPLPSSRPSTDSPRRPPSRCGPPRRGGRLRRGGRTVADRGGATDPRTRVTETAATDVIDIKKYNGCDGCDGYAGCGRERNHGQRIGGGRRPPSDRPEPT